MNHSVIEQNVLSYPGFGVRNNAIMASAGTGKTYQLAMRYIRLLVCGALPEEIVAITFTKKAAGEIFEKIITELLAMIQNPEKLSTGISSGFLPQGTDHDTLVRVLRSILASREKLHIETNDSFLMQLLQGAPAEFGISGEISMLDEEDDLPRRQAMFRTLSGIDEDGKRELFEILKNISYGKQKTSLFSSVISVFKTAYPIFLEHPDRESWLLPDIVRKEDVLDLTQVDRICNTLESVLHGQYYPKLFRDARLKIVDKYKKLTEAARNAVFYRPNLKGLDFFLTKLFTDRNDLFGTTRVLSFVFYKKEYEIDGELLDITRMLVKHLAAQEIRFINAKSQAVYELMKKFDTAYSSITRKAGKLTFSDIVYLINQKAANNFGAMQVLNERLNQKISHYLLDEFQDTSSAQWNAMKDLCNEIIYTQAPETFTSFFAVGDIKQSIYQWRKGNPDLLRMFCNSFVSTKTAETCPPPDPSTPYQGIHSTLTKSYRSTEPVLDAVNQVFLNEPYFPGRLSDAAVSFKKMRQAMDFEKHTSGLGKLAGTGCSMLLAAPQKTEEEEDCIPQLICNLIREIDPFSPEREKTLSIAILFRRNKNILTCFEEMRKINPNLPLSLEGSMRLSESMAYSVFRQMLRLAEHPGDRTALELFAMLKLPGCIPGINTMQELFYPGQKGSFSSLIRKELYHGGYLSLYHHFLKVFPNLSAFDMDRFTLMQQELQKADKDGTFSITELLDHLDTLKAGKNSIEKTVQLMTYHKSKGLGFDIVILPDEAADGSHETNLQTDEQCGKVYYSPATDLLKFIPETEKTNTKINEAKYYEFCCNLYVAMTRAKFGLYLFVREENKESKAETVQIPDVLRATIRQTDISTKTNLYIKNIAGDIPLRPLYLSGDPEWYKLAENKKNTESNELACFLNTLPDIMQSVSIENENGPVMSAPSRTHERTTPALLRFRRSDAAELGTEVHEILKDFDWFETPEQTAEFLRTHCNSQETRDLLEKAFSCTDIRSSLSKNDSGNIVLWKEKKFLTKIDGRSVSGCFDRVAIKIDENGYPVNAEIIDYKTDQITDPNAFIQNYHEQLELYRKALVNLTGLPEDKICCTLLALRSGMAVLLD